VCVCVCVCVCGVCGVWCVCACGVCGACVCVCVCVCSLSYPACNARTPYCHLWLARLYIIFPHLIKARFSRKKALLNTKCVFWYPLQLSETFLVLIRIECEIKKCLVLFMYSSCYSGPILMKHEFSRDFFFSNKYTNIKFHENTSSGSRVFPCRQMDLRTDRHDEVNSRFSQFCERSWKLFN